MNQTKNTDIDFMEDLCKWVDGFHLSRQKKDLNRDFSDAYLVAEILSHFYPTLVNLNNYPTCHDTLGKIENWNTLKSKVFQKIGMKLSNEEIENLANWRTNAIEHFLSRLRANLENKKAILGTTPATKKERSDDEDMVVRSEQPISLHPLRTEYKTQMMNTVKENITEREIGHDDEEVKELYENYDKINELEAKMNQLKVTIKAKDRQIKDLEMQFTAGK